MEPEIVRMLKPLINFFNPGGLLRDSSVLFVGLAGVNVLNVLFQMVMGRCLMPEEYALLISLLGVFNILSIPLGVVSSAVNRYSSLLIQQGRIGDVRRLVRRWAIRLLVGGLLVSSVCFLFPHALASFFHLDRVTPIFIFGIILVGVFCRPVFDGAMMGMQCFVGFSVSSVLGWSTRLVTASLFVLCISPYSGWGLLGHGLGFYVALAIGVFFVFRRLRDQQPSEKPLPQMHAYMFGSFFVLLGYSILMTGDVVLVKHLFPNEAPSFSYAATLGRLVIFIPQAFIAAMFPKVVSDKKVSAEQQKIFIRTIVATFVMTVVSAMLFVPLTRLGIFVLFGNTDPSSEMILWSRLLAGAMVPVALLNVVGRFMLAQHRFPIASIIPIAAIVYIAGVLFLVQTPAQVVMLLSGLSVFSLVLMWVVARIIPERR